MSQYIQSAVRRTAAVMTRYDDLFINYSSICYQMTFPRVPLPPELCSLSCLCLFRQWQHAYLSRILAHTQGQNHSLSFDLNRKPLLGCV